MASQSVASSGNAAANDDDGSERGALIDRISKKFPHLFKKTPQPNNPTGCLIWLTATPMMIDDAFREMERSGDDEDLAGFKNLISWSSQVNRETRLIRNVTPGARSRIRDDLNYDWLDESLFAIRNPNVKPPDAVEETATEPPISVDDDLEPVRFDFGDDYGNRREFAELQKELLRADLRRLSATERPPRVPKYNDKDISKSL